MLKTPPSRWPPRHALGRKRGVAIPARAAKLLIPGDDSIHELVATQRWTFGQSVLDEAFGSGLPPGPVLGFAVTFLPKRIEEALEIRTHPESKLRECDRIGPCSSGVSATYEDCPGAQTV